MKLTDRPSGCDLPHEREGHLQRWDNGGGSHRLTVIDQETDGANLLHDTDVCMLSLQHNAL